MRDTPPCDIGAERQLLGAALIAPSVIDELTDVIRPADFYRPAHETIWQAILDQHNDTEPVDAKLIGERLRVAAELNMVGGLPYLHGLISDVLTATNATWYARIVSRCAQQRKLIEAGQRIIQWAEASDLEDVEMVHVKAREELEAAAEARSSDDVIWAHESVLETFEALAEPRAGKSSPWSDLDDILSGFSPGRLYVIGARPGVGKTVFGLDVAKHHAMEHGEAVAYFTLEMSRREIDARLLSSTAKVDFTHIERHQLTDHDHDRISSIHGDLAAMPLTVIDKSNQTVHDIRRIARNISKTRKLGMIVVDYLQLMSHTNSRLERREVVADISRSLKLLSRELNIAVVAMSQLNRSSETRRGQTPMLHDLRESGSVEQDADVVILLHREVEGEHQNVMNVGVAKNRHGMTDSLKMDFQGQYQRIMQTAWTPSSVLQ